MKKTIASLAVVALLLAALPMTAFASHGNSRHGGAQPVQYVACTTKNCTKTGLHTHNGITYTAHYYGDGHNYHAYCANPDCTLAGYHSHDGTYCFGHTANDGHSYHQARHGGGQHH